MQVRRLMIIMLNQQDDKSCKRHSIKITKGRDSLSRPYKCFIFISPHSADLKFTC